MKNIILITLLVVSVQLNAQRDTIHLSSIFPVINDKINYSEIVILNDTLKKEQLYNKLKQIIVSTIKSDKNIIQNEDINIGIIQSTGYILKGHNPYVENPQIWYVFKIEVKDGKFKYSLSDLTYKFDVKIATEFYGNTITNNKNLNQAFEEWISPSKKRGSLDRKEIENFLRKVDLDLKTVITSVVTQMQQKEEVW